MRRPSGRQDGSYPGDNIVAANAMIASCPANNGVTIQGESRAGVVIQHVYYGNQPDGQATAAPHNLTLTGVTLTWGMEINGAAVNDVIDNVDGGSIAVSGTANERHHDPELGLGPVRHLRECVQRPAGRLSERQPHHPRRGQEQDLLSRIEHRD